MEVAGQKTSMPGKIGWAIVGGIIAGLVTAVYVGNLPYNRIVVPFQATSSVVKVTSAHLSQPGFIVIFAMVSGGWQQVGDSYMLLAGYHRNIVIPIAHDVLTEQVKRQYIARIYMDIDADSLFNPETDKPVLGMDGKPLTRHFWLDVEAHPWRTRLMHLRVDPVGLVSGYLIP